MNDSTLHTRKPSYVNLLQSYDISSILSAILSAILDIEIQEIQQNW